MVEVNILQGSTPLLISGVITTFFQQNFDYLGEFLQLVDISIRPISSVQEDASNQYSFWFTVLETSISSVNAITDVKELK